MFYNLTNAQGIQVVVNIGTSTSAHAPLAKTAPILTTETSISAPEIDQIMDVVAALNVRESSPPPVSTKRVRDKD